MTALRFGLFVLGLAACLAPSASFAVEFEPYVEYDVGLTIMRNQNLTRANPPTGGLTGRIESDPGFNVGGAVGVKFLEHFRTEVNVGYRQNQINHMAIQPGNKDGKGTLSMIHVMTNAYAEYDFDLGVIPYFGLGVGYGMVEIDGNNKTDAIQIDSDDNAFLWNIMVGGSVPFSDVTTFTFGYRYMQTEDLNFRARIATIGPRQVDSEYDAHELVFGIRYSF